MEVSLDPVRVQYVRAADRGAKLCLTIRASGNAELVEIAAAGNAQHTWISKWTGEIWDRIHEDIELRELFAWLEDEAFLALDLIYGSPGPADRSVIIFEAGTRYETGVVGIAVQIPPQLRRVLDRLQQFEEKALAGGFTRRPLAPQRREVSGEIG